MSEQEITGDKLKSIAWFLTETVQRKPMQQKVRTSVGEEGGGGDKNILIYLEELQV